MRLLELKIKNLASLRGEHAIDFRELSAQDLFAITGETGAGKSTILNALSLALYGRLFKGQTFSQDLVTLGERDTAVEVRFLAKGHEFLVKWTLSVLKKDGTPVARPAPNRLVYRREQSDWQIREEAPADLLGLDFEQFTKCVVLNQGEFARFLLAPFGERRTILEKLYPSDNLDAIGGIVRQRLEAEAQKKQTLEIQLHGLQEELLFDAAQAQDQHRALLAKKESMQAGIEVLRPWALGLAELAQLSQRDKESAQREAQLKADHEKSTLEHNKVLSLFEEGERALTALDETLARDLPGLEADDKEERALRELAASLREQEKSLGVREEETQRLRLRQEALTRDLAVLAREAQSLLSSLPYAPAQLQRLDWEELNAVAEELRLLRQELGTRESFLQKLQTSGEAQAKALAELQEQSEQLRGQLPLELRALAAPLRTQKIRDLVSLQLRFEAREREAQELRARQAQLQHDIAARAPELHELRLLQENHVLRSKLEALKDLLRTAPPSVCPLCLSQGPHWHEGLAPVAQAFDQPRLEFLEGELQRNELELRGIAERLERQSAETPVAIPARELTRIVETQDQLLALEARLPSATEALQASRRSWHELQSEVTNLRGKLQALLQRRGELERSFQELFAEASALDDEALARLLALRPLLVSYFEKERALQQLQGQQRTVAEDLHRAQLAVQELRAVHLALKAEHQERAERLRQRHPSGPPAQELKRRQEELRQAQQRQQIAVQALRKSELQLAEGRSLLARYKEQREHIDLQFTTGLSRLKALRPIAVELAEAALLLPPLLLQAQQELAASEAELEAIVTELGKLATLLEEDARRRDKLSLYQQQLQRAQAEGERWLRVHEVLGTDELRTFVLGLVEAALIQQTNHELQRLCAGRYEIQHSQRKDRPEFYIVDRWREGLVRKVSTLSGGETFMVSLAMALALAEMARGRAEIECLFIDEGFGTLDENALEDVMEMLQQVRSSGKQIGVITHVKALSSRLPINLLVSKNGHGNSTLQLCYS